MPQWGNTTLNSLLIADKVEVRGGDNVIVNYVSSQNAGPRVSRVG